MIRRRSSEAHIGFKIDTGEMQPAEMEVEMQVHISILTLALLRMLYARWWIDP